jgi:isochorismate synthase
VTGGGALHARAWRVDRAVDPLDVAGPGGVVWESAGQVIAGRGEALRLELRDRADAACRLQQELAGVIMAGDADAPGPAAVAALPFDPGAPASAVVPALQLRQQAEGVRWLIAVAATADAVPVECPHLDHGRPSAPRPCRHELCAVEEPEAWMATVAAARDEIRRGALRKVVLARAVDLVTDVDLDVAAVLRRLRAVYPTCLRFSVDGLVGASPELLVARRGDVVSAQPMAGTTARLGDPAVDAQLAARLLASDKDRAEHQVTIERVEEALLPFCSYLDAQADPQVVAVANVQHLATRVEGRLSQPSPPVLDLVAALHPTPAVGGDPAGAALAAIDRLEPRGRGRYAGPVGWCDGSGDGEFAVGIRSAEISGRRARLYAGVGVVADSEPEAELAESQAKLQAMLGALLRP